jgi:hypothetical protein
MRFGALVSEAEVGTETGDDGVFDLPAVQSGFWNLVAVGAEGGGVVTTLVADKDVDGLRIENPALRQFGGRHGMG